MGVLSIFVQGAREVGSGTVLVELLVGLLVSFWFLSEPKTSILAFSWELIPIKLS